jgi:hypothetical protein
VLERLSQRERPFRNLLVTVNGDHSGVWLALEAGLQRFTGFAPSTHPAHLQVSLVARRTALTDAEWTLSRIDPPTPPYDALTKRRPVRDHDAHAARVVVPGGARVEVRPGEYWRRLEEVALEHLLHFERSDEDRDAQLRPLLARDELASVRAEVRKGNVILAIKRYREITGVGLKEAKEAVEAMRGAEPER